MFLVLLVGEVERDGRGETIEVIGNRGGGGGRNPFKFWVTASPAGVTLSAPLAVCTWTSLLLLLLLFENAIDFSA